MALAHKYKRVLAGTGLALGALVVFGVYSVYMPAPASKTTLPTTVISIGKTTIEVELASTEAEREQGLSGRTSLSDGQGMFFVFDTEGVWGIWMKDMRFSLDILWADTNGIIVTIERDVSPASYPKSFYPNVPAAYVLEVPAGFTKAHGIAVGQKIVVQ